MPYATTDDGVRLYYEETGKGRPLILVHEFAGDLRSFEPPSLYSLVEEMKKMTVPTLVISGDEDWPCLLPGILMKQSIPSAALSIIPNAGHAINIEEPDEYNRIVGEFLSQVDSGRWPLRDPRAISKSITGISP